MLVNLQPGVREQIVGMKASWWPVGGPQPEGKTTSDHRQSGVREKTNFCSKENTCQIFVQSVQHETCESARNSEYGKKRCLPSPITFCKYEKKNVSVNSTGPKRIITVSVVLEEQTKRKTARPRGLYIKKLTVAQTARCCVRPKVTLGRGGGVDADEVRKVIGVESEKFRLSSMQKHTESETKPRKWWIKVTSHESKRRERCDTIFPFPYIYISFFLWNVLLTECNSRLHAPMSFQNTPRRRCTQVSNNNSNFC